MVEYTYTLPEVPHLSTLQAEIEVAIPVFLDGLNWTESTLLVVFGSEITPLQKTQLDALVATHIPQKPPNRRMLGTSSLVQLETAVINQAEWQTVAGVVSRPAFFTPNLSAIVGQVLGQMFCVGGGAEVRLVEIAGGLSGGFVEMSAPYEVPDTHGHWPILYFLTSQPPSQGANVYSLEARLNSAASLKIRNTSLSLIELVP